MDDSNGWDTNSMRLEEIQNLSKLEIRTTMKMLNIILKDGSIFYETNISQPLSNRKIIWEIDEEIFKYMQHSHNGKAFASGIFYDQWSIMIYPNGGEPDSDGWCDIMLQGTAGLISNIDELQVKWNTTAILKVDEENIIQKEAEWINEFDFENDIFSWGQQILSHEKIKQSTQMTVIIDIEIIPPRAEDEELALTKWTEYVQENRKKKLEISDNKKYDERFDLLENKLELISLQLNNAMAAITKLQESMDKLK